MVGASPSECDTIPGRQSMAQCFFILKQFDDVLVYLKSIRPYFINDDDFNWNFGIADEAITATKTARSASQDIVLRVLRGNFAEKNVVAPWVTQANAVNMFQI